MNADEGKAGVVLFAGKLYDPRLSALSVPPWPKKRYKILVLSFPFLWLLLIFQLLCGILNETSEICTNPFIPLWHAPGTRDAGNRPNGNGETGPEVTANKYDSTGSCG